MILTGAPEKKEGSVFTEDYTIDLKKVSPSLGNVIDMDVDSAGNLYLLDTKSCKVVMLTNKGEIKGEFGKKGAKPGEIDNPSNIRLTASGQVVLADIIISRFSFFNKDGKFVKEMRFEPGAAEGFMLDNGNFILKKFVYPTYRGGNMTYSSVLYNSASIEIKPLDTMERPTPQAPKELGIFYHMGVGISKDKIITGNQVRGYDFWVSDFSGKLIRHIQRKSTPVQPWEDYKKAFIRNFGESYDLIKNKLEFPKVLPAFHYFATDEDGRLFVMTYEKDKVSGGYMVDIFGPDGGFVTRAALRFPMLDKGTLRIKNNRLYYLHKNETGFQQISVYKIDLKKSK